MAFRNPILAGNQLVRNAIQSPNYVTGSAGWIIRRDGSAEFSNAIFRGSVDISGSNNLLMYSGTPAAGDLVMSMAPNAGTDSFGNVYPQGLSVGNGTGKAVVVGLTGGAPLIYFVSNAPNLTNGAALQDIILGAGTGQYDFLQILSAENTTNNDLVLQGFAGSSQDGTQLATINQQYKDNLGAFHTYYALDKNGPRFPLGLAVTGTLTQTGQVAIARSTDSSAVNATYITTANATNAAYAYTAAGATGRLLSAIVAGDAFGRFVVDVNGTATWGSGAAARDTTLERVAAGVLATIGNFLVGGSSALGDNGVGELQLANATTVPTTNPTGGGVLYEHQGVPTHRDPGGQLLGMVRAYSARATGLLSSFTTEADIPGATVNVVVTGSNATILATAVWDMNAGGAAATFVGFFNWNGSDQTAQGIHTANGANERDTVSQTYEITGVTAGTYTAKLRASCTVSNNLNQAGGTHTGFTLLVIDQ